MVEIVVALITGVLMLIGNVVIAHKQNNIVLYRLDQLEQKQDKHNDIIKKHYALEGEVKQISNRLTSISKRIP